MPATLGHTEEEPGKVELPAETLLNVTTRGTLFSWLFCVLRLGAFVVPRWLLESRLVTRASEGNRQNPPREQAAAKPKVAVYTTRYQPGMKYWKSGGSGTIYTHPNHPTEVYKISSNSPSSTKDMEIEKRVYERLGHHPNILRCLSVENYGLRLQYAEHSSIREYFAEGGTATMDERINWSRDTALALQHVHDHGVRHADLGGRNLLLGSSRTILLCDFGGSAIDNEPPTVLAESGFKHPDASENRQTTIQSELHALGSTIYELITSSQPHAGVEDRTVHQWIQEGRYPDVEQLRLGDIITKCWKGQYTTAKEVAQGIEQEMKHCINSDGSI